MLWWCPEHLKMMLDRSRGAPISLETDRELESTTALCALLAPHAMRARSIALRYPEDHHAVDVFPVLRLVAFSPILERLHLRNVHETGCKWERDIPGPPISLEMVDSLPDMIAGLVNPFLHRIVRLTLSVPEDVTRHSSFPRHLGEILGRMPMLEILTLSHLSDCTGTDQFTVHLPRLTLFRMDDVYASRVGLFVEHLVIPPTTRFRITEGSYVLPRLPSKVFEGVRHITLAGPRERSASAEEDTRWVLSAYTGDPSARPPPVPKVEIVVPISFRGACLTHLTYSTTAASEVETVELVNLRASYDEDVWEYDEDVWEYDEDVWDRVCFGLGHGAIETVRLTRCASGAVRALLDTIHARADLCQTLRRIEVRTPRFSEPEKDMREMLEAREALRTRRTHLHVEMEWGDRTVDPESARADVGVSGEEETTSGDP